MTSVPNDAAVATTLIPFALWTAHGPERQALDQLALPHLQSWLAQARRVDVQTDAALLARMAAEPLSGAAPAPSLSLPHLPPLPLSPPHERAWAQALGWPVRDGCLPWAAQAAAECGLSQQGWAFITLCHWQVSHGQATLLDPAYLQLDAATDAALFAAMQGFFAEDGIRLHPYKTGQWLAQSPLLVGLPTAALDRVIGRNIDPWLVASQLLRRLQNEMQMLLYTHPANQGRPLSANSFWVHGTGDLPQPQRDTHLSAATHASLTAPELFHTPATQPQLDCSLRASALAQDLAAWLRAWQQLDAGLMAQLQTRAAAGEPQRLVLCGEHAFHVYENPAAQRLARRRAGPGATHSRQTLHAFWQGLRTRWAKPSLGSLLTLAPF